MPPEQFGRYRLEAVLGRGGMGEVHRAFDTVHRRTVAVKRLLPDYMTDEQFRARFFRECHAAAQLNDPHVIPIHDFGEIEGRLYLDMRLVEGKDLAGVLAESGPLPPDAAVDVATQIASALDSAHAIGLVHRDVKPSNVLVDRTGPVPHCYLVDFGVAGLVGARTTGSLTRTGMIAGTLDYVAPERLEGRPTDGRADVYSLACLLYETLTGLPPFDCDTVAALCYAHLFRDPPQPSQVVPSLPAALDAVVARGMAKDPDARPARAGDLAAAAREALRSGTGPAPHPRIVHRAPGTVVPPPGPPVGATAPDADVPVDSPVSPLPTRRRPAVGGRRPVSVLVAGLLLATAAVGGFLVAGGSPPAQGTTIHVEPAVETGTDPFVPASVEKDGTSGPGPSTEPTATGPGSPPSGPVAGDTPGLYGGSGSDTCDAGGLAAYLEDHPDRGDAWAGALGLARASVDAYLRALTPLVLRADTAVTNHRYQDGVATPFHSVLQAGTAVLVDRQGVPRVRCACGNPLAPAVHRPDPSYEGPAWAGFDSRAVIVIAEAATVLSAFVVVEEGSDAVEVRPAGTTGEQDQPASPEDAAEAREFGEPEGASGSTTPDPPAPGSSTPGTPTESPADEPAADDPEGTTDDEPSPGAEDTSGNPDPGTEPPPSGGAEPSAESPSGDPGTGSGTGADTGTDTVPTTPEAPADTGTGPGTTEDPAGTGTGTDTGTDTGTGTGPSTTEDPAGTEPATTDDPAGTGAGTDPDPSTTGTEPSTTGTGTDVPTADPSGEPPADPATEDG